MGMLSYSDRDQTNRQERSMHMTFQTYRTIKRTLAQTLKIRPASHHEQYINTLAMVICGIVGAQHVQFAHIAEHAPLRGGKMKA